MFIYDVATWSYRRKKSEQQLDCILITKICKVDRFIYDNKFSVKLILLSTDLHEFCH